MDESEVRLLLGLFGEDCCCCCEERAERERAKRAQRPFRPGATAPHLAPYQMAQPAGIAPGTGRPSMPMRRRGRPVDEPFVPPLPSYDTPQRPGVWGLPMVDEETGAYGSQEGGGSTGRGIPTLYDDTGRPHFLNTLFRVDHDERWVKSYSSTMAPEGEALSAGAVPFPWHVKLAEQPPSPKLPDSSVEATTYRWYSGPLRERPGRTFTLITYEHRLGFDGTPEQTEVGRSSGAATVYTGDVTIYQRDGWDAPWVARTPVAYRVVIDWYTNGFVAPPDYLARRVEATEARIAWTREDGSEREEWVKLITRDRYYVTPEEAQRAGYTTETTFRDVTLLEEEVPPSLVEMPPPPDRFRAAGGRVVITAPPSGNPSDLTNLSPNDDTPAPLLTAWGRELRGGSWAALRGPPKRREDGTWDFSAVMVLHESGGTVTAVWPDGRTETCPRERFEVEVLRCEPGAFRFFTDSGALFTDWPQPWAFADCTTDTRALAAHDPWRDSVKRQAAGKPASWVWPSRPARRPKAVPTSAPRTPLGVALANVGGAMGDAEPLPRGQAPLLLPSRVEVWRDGAWQESDTARKALSKRILYPPARWPEELDDRTSVKGRLRLTYPGAAPPTDAQGYPKTYAHLLIRAKRPRRPLTLTRWQDGAGTPLPAALLGHNAAEPRGWHPYLLTAGLLPPGPVVIELDSPVPLSRALLYLRLKGRQFDS